MLFRSVLSLLPLGGLLLALPLAAQKPHTPHPATITLDQPEPAWHMEANRRVVDKTGRPAAIYQENYVPQATDPEAIAREYLTARRGTLGLTPDDIQNNLKLHRVRPSQTGHTVRLRQLWKGLPVNRNAEVTVHIRPDGVVDWLQNGYVYGIDLQVVTPVFATQQARQRVLDHLQLGTTTQYETTELMVVRHAEKDYLVHHLNFGIEGVVGEWDAYVDAMTNDILKVEDINIYHHHDDPELPTLPYIWLGGTPVMATGTGNVFRPDPLSSATATYGATGYVDGNDANTTQLTAQNQNVTLLDIELLAGVYKLKGPYAEIQDFEAPFKGLFTQSTSAFNFSRNADAFEAVNTYYHIDDMMRYLNVTLGLSITPYQYATGVRFDPSAVNGDDNSYYTSGQGRLAFGEGGVDDAEDADVIIHELGHGLHDWVTVGGLSQVNGLSEGSGDYIAGSYSRHIGYWASNQTAYNWVFNWDGHNPFWNGRVLNYAPIYPAGLVGAIHTDGQIWSTANMKVWNDIGRQNADKAFWSGLDVTNGSTNQNDAANAVYQAAINLGYSYAHRLAIHTRYVAAGYTMPAPPAPVELLRFEATRAAATSVLTWATASEEDNDYFVVERSADGTHFESLGRVKGAGDAYTEQRYAYTDLRPLGGTNFYRLQQTDFDGKTSYSPIVSVRFDDAATLAAYPNPAGQELTVVSPVLVGVVSILDANGQVLRSQNIDNETAKTTTRLSLEGLAPGLYWVQVIGDGQVLTTKIFKSE
jgi:zinc metalloprotease ZmpB